MSTMLLAQIQEGTELAKQVLKTSSDYGFAAFALMVLFVTVAIGAAIHFVKVVCPERDARIKSQEKVANCMTVMTAQDIRQTALLEQQAVANGEIKSKLSDLKELASQSKCEARIFARSQG
jgi:hypothetical protein